MTQRELERTHVRFVVRLGVLTLVAGAVLLCIGGILTPLQVLDHPVTWWAGFVLFVWWLCDRSAARVDRRHARLERQAVAALRRSREQEAAARRDTRPAGNVIQFERRRPADVVEFPGRDRAS